VPHACIRVSTVCMCLSCSHAIGALARDWPSWLSLLAYHTVAYCIASSRHWGGRAFFAGSLNVGWMALYPLYLSGTLLTAMYAVSNGCERLELPCEAHNPLVVAWKVLVSLDVQASDVLQTLLRAHTTLPDLAVEWALEWIGSCRMQCPLP
jgi:hypothetical protein